MLEKGPKFRVFNTEWFDVKILGPSHKLAPHPMSKGGGGRRRRFEYHLPWGLLAHVAVIVEKWFSKFFEWKEMLGGKETRGKSVDQCFLCLGFFGHHVIDSWNQVIIFTCFPNIPYDHFLWKLCPR